MRLVWLTVLIAAISTACAAAATLEVQSSAPTPTVAEDPLPEPTPTAVPTATVAPTPTVPPTATPVPTSTPTPTATPTPGPTSTPLPTPTPTPIPRILTEQDFVQFGVAAGIPLHYPAAIVELVGFHESGHDGAKGMDFVGAAGRSAVLETRDRDTHPQGAADIVVAPDSEIRAPATGTVVAASTYVLYCQHSDDLVYIEPDEQPGWQIRIFHISGIQVAIGDRVEAGVTVLAPRATQLPFDSQVDFSTAEPSWPHVHIEVVDPSVPDRPTDTPGC